MANRTATVSCALALAAIATCAGAQGAPRMEVVKSKDVTGEVFKRLGLPNQDYCWEQCLKEARCTGARWGYIVGSTPGQCQLMSGELKFDKPHEIKTYDGQSIRVIASRKVQ